MYIRIGSFSKRHNSTKQPAANWGTRLNVDLKEDCSMEEPVFKLGFSAWNPAYNYIYCEEWNRYYFVVNVTVNIGRIWEVQCKLDTAGTYKADIQAMNAFVLYDSAGNTEIVDERLPTKTTASYLENSTPLSANASSAGSYLCCATGEAASHIFKIPNVSWLSNIIGDPDNGLAAYLSNEFPSIEGYSSDWLEGLVYYLKQAGKNLIGSGSNVFNNIRSILWVPWNVQTSQTASFDLGIFHSGAVASIVTTLFEQSTVSIPIPWQFNDWRRNEPYTFIYLYIPFVGVIHIPSSQVIGQSNINIQMAFNQQNGEIAFRIYSGSVQLGAYGANTAVSIPFGASQVTPAQKITALAGTAGGVAAAVSAGNVIGVAAAAASLAAIRPIGASVGGIGGGAGGGLDLNLRCFTICHDTIVTPNSIASTIGTPTMAQQSLAGKSGYVRTQNASVQGDSMSDAARQEINAMCDGGIYME